MMVVDLPNVGLKKQLVSLSCFVRARKLRESSFNSFKTSLAGIQEGDYHYLVLNTVDSFSWNVVEFFCNDLLCFSSA